MTGTNDRHSPILTARFLLPKASYRNICTAQKTNLIALNKEQLNADNAYKYTQYMQYRKNSTETQ